MRVRVPPRVFFQRGLPTLKHRSSVNRNPSPTCSRAFGNHSGMKNAYILHDNAWSPRAGLCKVACAGTTATRGKAQWKSTPLFVAVSAVDMVSFSKATCGEFGAETRVGGARWDFTCPPSAASPLFAKHPEPPFSIVDEHPRHESVCS